MGVHTETGDGSIAIASWRGARVAVRGHGQLNDGENTLGPCGPPPEWLLPHFAFIADLTDGIGRRSLTKGTQASATLGPACARRARKPTGRATPPNPTPGAHCRSGRPGRAWVRNREILQRRMSRRQSNTVGRPSLVLELVGGPSQGWVHRPCSRPLSAYAARVVKLGQAGGPLRSPVV